MLRIGILTSGGDCQALNAAMRGVVKGITSKRNDVEIYGFKDGYKGLIYSRPAHFLEKWLYFRERRLFYGECCCPE